MVFMSISENEALNVDKIMSVKLFLELKKDNGEIEKNCIYIKLSDGTEKLIRYKDKISAQKAFFSATGNQDAFDKLDKPLNKTMSKKSKKTKATK